MQDPNADTEWNDVLRSKGILPPKQEKEINEDDIVNMIESTIQQKSSGKDLQDMNLDELDAEEDDIDEEEERIFEEYRRQRMMELKASQAKARYGDVLEISKADWVREINKAGEGVWVILHIYQHSIPLCKLVNEHIYQLARKFPDVKFAKGVSETCIPNYPDKNLPTLFVYHEGDMKKQWIGALSFGGMNFKCDELEWMLSEVGALKTTLEENPRKAVTDEMARAMKQSRIDDSDDDNDW